MGALTGKVAVVTGASRGIGKGIALALGAEGATVYVTGRTVTPGSYPLPGTVGETAEEVDHRGGKGVAVNVDHADDEQVSALFDQIRREQGRIDILVNNAFALPEDLTEPAPFWEKPLSHWGMVDVGVRSNYVAARHAATMMVPQESGLIVAISGYAAATYTYGVWRIAVRTNVIEWSGMVSTMPLPFAEVPDIHGNGAPSRSKADPSYHRPLVNRRDRHNPLDI